MLFFSCFYLGDFVIPVLSSISAFDRVTIVYFLAVAGPCPRGTGPTLLPTKFHDRRGIVLSPSRRQLGRLFPFPSSLCVVNFPRQFCNHNPLITFHRSPYHRQGRFGPDIPSHPLPDLLVSRAFSFLFSISSCPRREAYFYFQPYASARAAFSTPCRTHERHLTIHSETWSLKASMAVINITSPYYHEYYLDHKSTETRGDKAGMTHDMQEDPDTTEEYKERRAKSLRSRALPSTPSTSTGRSTTSRKSGGGKAGVRRTCTHPLHTMPRDRPNHTHYPLQVNLHRKKGSPHEFRRTEWLRWGDEQQPLCCGRRGGDDGPGLPRGVDRLWDPGPRGTGRAVRPPHPSPLGAALWPS